MFVWRNNFKCFSILQICTRHEFCTFPGSDPDFFQMTLDQGLYTPSSYKQCLCEVRIYTVFFLKNMDGTQIMHFSWQWTWPCLHDFGSMSWQTFMIRSWNTNFYCFSIQKSLDQTRILHFPAKDLDQLTLG